jgi:hypothetical protein
LIRVGLHAAGQGLSDHKRCGGLEFAAQQVGGAGRLEAEGPPVLTIHADLGEFHPAFRLLAGSRDVRRERPLARENRLMRRLLRTVLQPAGSLRF